MHITLRKEHVSDLTDLMLQARRGFRGMTDRPNLHINPSGSSYDEASKVSSCTPSGSWLRLRTTTSCHGIW